MRSPSLLVLTAPFFLSKSFSRAEKGHPTEAKMTLWKWGFCLFVLFDCVSGCLLMGELMSSYLTEVSRILLGICAEE